MSYIDPVPILREDGGADFKEKTCPLVCYSKNRDGITMDSCEFLQKSPGWVCEEFDCTAPGC